MPSHFQATKENPYHISVGAVLVNAENKVCCHYFPDASTLGRGYAIKELHILMRESLENNETLEQALVRGLMEEFSATATMERYLGSTMFTYMNPNGPTETEKTTLYFLCRLIDIKPERKEDDPEAMSELQWHDIDELIVVMDKQQKAAGWKSEGDPYFTGNEAGILKRAKKYLK